MKLTIKSGKLYDKVHGETFTYNVYEDIYLTPFSEGEKYSNSQGHHGYGWDNGAVAFGEYEYGNEINFQTGEIGEGYFNPKPRLR